MRRRGLLLGLLLGLTLGIAQAMSLSDAVRKVEKETGGKILSAVTRVENGREVHVIRVLTPDGKVRTVRVPGRKREDPRARPGR